MEIKKIKLIRGCVENELMYSNLRLQKTLIQLSAHFGADQGLFKQPEPLSDKDIA